MNYEPGTEKCSPSDGGYEILERSDAVEETVEVPVVVSSTSLSPSMQFTINRSRASSIPPLMASLTFVASILLQIRHV